jgi:SMC interacting uncharacterized protein involved in chromosome segregation
MEEQIFDLQRQIDELKRQVYKNQFSNLYVFDEQVKFRSNLIFPKDETQITCTSVVTSTWKSDGRITIKDDTGATRYIPYFT